MSRLGSSGDSEIDQLIKELSERPTNDGAQLEDGDDQGPKNRTAKKRSRRTKRRKGKNSWDIRFDRRAIAEMLDDLYGQTSDWESMYFTEDAKYRKPKAAKVDGVEKEVVMGEKERVKKTKKVEKTKNVKKTKKEEKTKKVEKTKSVEKTKKVEKTKTKEVETTKKVEEKKGVEEQVMEKVEKEEEEEEGHYGLIMCMSF